MVPNTRLRLAPWLCGGALLLAACGSVAPAAPTATNVVAATAATATQPAATSTSAPDTPTALPVETATAPPTASATATVTGIPSSTAAPTDTPGSPTAAPTQPASPTAPGSLTAAPTRVPITITPLGPPDAASVTGSTSGPAGYSSSIKCQCTPVMPPGDISFSLVLSGAAAAPWTHFVYYGLSVEKDGANAASMFMFVDSGWLQPGAVVGFGTSRNFNQPGRYVIRSSGCMTTDTKSNNCAWTTIAGDVVSFVIQP